MGRTFTPMTVRSLPFRRALFILSCALMLARFMGHGHHEDVTVFAEQLAGSMVKEHCPICDLLHQPTETMASQGRSILMIASLDLISEGAITVQVGRVGQASNRGPPLQG